mgnify:CR=1 FL=1
MNVSQEGELILRLVTAFVLGGLFGLEREKRHKPAGLRTHTLVCLGAALFTIAGLYGFPGAGAGAPPLAGGGSSDCPAGPTGGRPTDSDTESDVPRGTAGFNRRRDWS